MKIAVLGAGISGTTTAYALTDKGHEVTLIDRERYAGMDTSYANGGQLSACNAETWHHPSTILKGMKWLFKKDAPLKLSLTPSWHKYSWFAEFLYAMRHYKANTIHTTQLAIAAREHLTRMAEEGGVEFDRVNKGMMHICGTQKGYEHGLKVNELLRKGGLERRAITTAEIKELEPTIHGDFVGGFFTESDFNGDIHKYCRGLAAACEKRGVQTLFGRSVVDLVNRNGIYVTFEDGDQVHFDAVVVCSGVGSRALAAKLGDRINIYPVKGYSITVNLDEASQAAAPWVSLNDDDAKIVTSRLGKDRYRVAGTAEFAGYNKDIRADRIKPLVEWTEKFFPGINTDQVVPWAGLRPMMPDMMPRVMKGKQPGVYYNTGHGHLGWTMSAATAYMLADLVD